jgi:hypothetical protein
MSQVHLHCTNAQGNVLDQRVADINDLIEAREYATCVARSLIGIPNLRDWRSCLLRVNDDLGEELFVIRFSSILGRLH